MTDKILLIKYGEIILKGLNRPVFEDKLIQNIRKAAGKDAARITKAQATVYVEPAGEADPQELAGRIARVFGVVSASVAHVTEKDMDKICAVAAGIMREVPGGSFKVEAKRADKRFPLQSPEICAMVGGAVCEANGALTVDVNSPDTTLRVEIRETAAYVYRGKVAGVGGMPAGTGGKAALLLSGGIDSPVAGYLMEKRGVELFGVHFYSYPYTGERARDKVLELARIIGEYSGSMAVYVVPFTEVQLAIRDKCPAEQMTLIMRRIMMKISDTLAKRHGACALVTGESLGQVASQTMESLLVTDHAAALPVFRPLIGMDKDEIVQIARRIGTFQTSILPYEDCCTVFTPRHPNTRPKLERILRSEGLLDLDGLMERALAGTERIETGRGV